MKTLTIDNRDLSYTIDTYGMFTGESTDEQEAEYYREEYGIEDIEFDYNHAGVVKALATASVQLLHQNFVQHGNGIVTEITLASEKSPQFYNYTTDSYTADWTIDTEKLQAYIEANLEKYRDFVRDNWHAVYLDIDWQDKDFTIVEDSEYHGKHLEDFDAVLVSAIDFYTSSEYDREDYEMTMFEAENEAWYENMNPTEEYQKLIDAKEQK